VPTYLYECPDCGEFEDFHKIGEHESTWPCPLCGAESRQLINCEGGCWGDEAPRWMVGCVEKGRAGSAMETLKHPSEPRFETRTEFKRYLKEKGLVQCG